MIDRKRLKGNILRSFRRANGYLEDAKRQGVNPNYNRGISYNSWAKEEIKYIIDTLYAYFG